MTRTGAQWIFLVVIGLVLPGVDSSAGDTPAPVRQPLSGTVASPMNAGKAGRGTVSAVPAGKLIALKEIYSPSKEFSAVADPDRKIITVYKIDWRGNIGWSRKYWETAGSFEVLGLLDDGEHLVAGPRGPDILPPDYENTRVILTFFKTGNPIAQVNLLQLITDFSKLQKVDSGYRWGRFLGLNAAGHFVVDTVEGKKIMLDVRTGKPVEFKPDEADRLAGWKGYRDIMRCFEFRYPASFVLQESLNVKGMPTGYASLKSGKKGKAIQISSEDLSLYPRESYSADTSFETFAIDRAKVMSSADGCGSSRYARDVVKEERFKNRHNLRSVELYLLEVQETYSENGKESKTEKRVRGPIYAVSIAQADERMQRMLFFEFAGDEENTPAEKELLRKIVDTVRILK